MYAHIFLNPFYWYSAIWSCVLLLYPLNWTEAYAPLDIRLALFFVLTVALSLVAGFFFGRYLKRIALPYRRPVKSGAFAILLILAYIADFLYAGFVPLFAVLSGSERTYKDFQGLPWVHGLLLAFSLFFGAYMFYCFLRETDRLRRLQYLSYVGVILLMFLLLYTRAFLMLMAFIIAVILLAFCRRIRAWHLLAAGATVILVLFLFGVLGNIRSESAWNDTSYLMQVAAIDPDKIPSLLPKQFLWTYVYLISPLGNLNNLVVNYVPTYEIGGVLYSLIPDIIGRLFFPDAGNVTLPLVIQNLTVLSGFGPMYYFGGFLGLITEFAYMVLVDCYLIRVSLYKSDYVYPVCSLTCTVTAFLFFDNFLNYSVVMFSFFYPVAVIVASALYRRFSPGHKSRYGTLLPLTPCVSVPTGRMGSYDATDE